MAIAQFVVEAVVNTLLFVNRQQGYNEDTIAGKLIRYQLLTTLFNVVVILACKILCKVIKKDEIKKYVLTASISLICFNVAFSHYQFAPTFLSFTMPLVFTIMYEDKRMCWNFTVIDIGLLILPFISRGTDPVYSENIVPEAIISVTVLIVLTIFSTIVIDVLTTRRKELNEVLLQAEKAKFVD